MDWRAVIPNILEDSRLKRELQGNVLLSVDWGMKGAKPSIMSLYSSTRVERPNRVEAQRFLFIGTSLQQLQLARQALVGREGGLMVYGSRELRNSPTAFKARHAVCCVCGK